MSSGGGRPPLSSREGEMHHLLKGRDDYNDGHMDIFVYIYGHTYIHIYIYIYIYEYMYGRVYAEAQSSLKGGASLLFGFFVFLFLF